jgi:hypothetical protein
LHLFGNGGGLYDVRVYVSFEEPPKSEQIDKLKFAVSEPHISGCADDMMDDRVLEFLKRAKKVDKKKLAKALDKEIGNGGPK